jgi:hypothetical protein
MILVDATYKLLELRMPVYLLMCIDGDGLSEIGCDVYFSRASKYFDKDSWLLVLNCPSKKKTKLV